MRELDQRRALSEIKQLFAHHPREDGRLNLILSWYTMLIVTNCSYKLVKSNTITLSENIVCSIEGYGSVDTCSGMRPKKFYLFLEARITYIPC